MFYGESSTFAIGTRGKSIEMIFPNHHSSKSNKYVDPNIYKSVMVCKFNLLSLYTAT